MVISSISLGIHDRVESEIIYGASRIQSHHNYLSVFQLGTTVGVLAGNPVSFAGQVKKVLADKNKVGIKDPETKKRFTIMVNKQTKLRGYSGIQDIQKKDSVTGKYVVTDKGLYIATEFNKE